MSDKMGLNGRWEIRVKEVGGDNEGMMLGYNIVTCVTVGGSYNIQ